MKRTLLFITMMMMVVAMVMPSAAVAQGPLTADEQALLDTVIAAMEAADDYTNFTSTTISTTTSATQATQGEAVLLDRVETEIETEHEQSIDDGVIENNLSTFERSFSRADSGEPVLAYTLTGELRFVDGAIYANLAFDTTAGDPGALPDGWVQVTEESLAAFPGLIEADLDDSLDAIDDDEPSTAERLVPIMETYTTDISVVAGAAADGSAVDVYTLRLSAIGMTEFYVNSAADDDDPLGELLIGYLTPSAAIVTIHIDGAGNAVYFGLETTATYSDIPLEKVNPEAPTGIFMSLDLVQSVESTIESLTEPSTPVEAPVIE